MYPHVSLQLLAALSGVVISKPVPWFPRQVSPRFSNTTTSANSFSIPEGSSSAFPQSPTPSAQARTPTGIVIVPLAQAVITSVGPVAMTTVDALGVTIETIKETTVLVTTMVPASISKSDPVATSAVAAPTLNPAQSSTSSNIQEPSENSSFDSSSHGHEHSSHRPFGAYQLGSTTSSAFPLFTLQSFQPSSALSTSASTSPTPTAALVQATPSSSNITSQGPLLTDQPSVLFTLLPSVSAPAAVSVPTTPVDIGVPGFPTEATSVTPTTPAAQVPSATTTGITVTGPLIPDNSQPAPSIIPFPFPLISSSQPASSISPVGAPIAPVNVVLFTKTEYTTVFPSATSAPVAGAPSEPYTTIAAPPHTPTPAAVTPLAPPPITIVPLGTDGSPAAPKETVFVTVGKVTETVTVTTTVRA